MSLASLTRLTWSSSKGHPSHRMQVRRGKSVESGELTPVALRHSRELTTVESGGSRPTSASGDFGRWRRGEKRAGPVLRWKDRRRMRLAFPPSPEHQSPQLGDLR